MILPLVSLVPSVAVGDLVDALAERSGWAYVAQTHAPYAPLARRPVEDLATWKVVAKNRWRLVVDPEAGWGRAEGMPLSGFFGAGTEEVFVRRGSVVSAVPAALRQLTPEQLSRPGGIVANVAELCLAAGSDPKRVHWRLRTRTVHARVSPGKGRASLAGLAAAVGGTFDAKTRKIGLAPETYRRQVVATLRDPEFDRALLPRPENVELAYARISSKELSELMWIPGNHVTLSIPGNDPAVREVVRSRMSSLRRGDARLADELQRDVDFVSPPSLRLSTDGTALLRFRKRGSELAYWYL